MRKSLFNKDIKPEILAAINKAKNQINLAVAWISDSDILDVLAQKAIQGIEVNLVLSAASDREILENLEKNSKAKIKIYVLGKEANNLMHHKFCVIDDSTTITGSYNYTHNAINNDENILLIDNDTELAKSYLDEFDRLLKQFNSVRKSNSVEFDVKLPEQEQHYRDEFVKLSLEWQECIAKSIRFADERNNPVLSDISSYFSLYLPATSWEDTYTRYARINKYQVQWQIEKWSKNYNYIGASADGLRYVDACQTPEFYILNTRINDLTPLGLFPNIGALCIENSEVEDFSFITSMENLKVLKISNCALTKLDFLPINSKLECLDLSNTLIEDFSNIKHLHNLKLLSLNNTFLKSIDFLRGHPNLEVLNICDTAVTNIRPIKQFSNGKYKYVYTDLIWPEIERQLPFLDNSLIDVFVDRWCSSTYDKYEQKSREKDGGVPF